MKKINFSHFFSAFFRSFRVELVHFFKDKALFSSVVVTGILVAFVYSAVYQNEIPQRIPVHVVDLSSSSLSRNFISMVGAGQNVNIVSIGNNLSDAKIQFEEGTINGIILIPEDFHKDITYRRGSSISLYSDASNMMINKGISTAVSKSLATFNAQIEVSGAMRRGMTYINSVNTRRAVTPISNALFNPTSGYATFLLPVVYLVIIQTLLLTGIGVLEGTMREYDNYHSIYKSSFNIVPILLGRSSAYLMICILLFSIAALGSMYVFEIPFRAKYLDVVVYLIPFFLSVIFLGFSLRGIFKKREDAALTITFTSIPAVFLSGISWPTFTFPTWVKVFSTIFPTTYGSRGFVALSQFGASFDEVETWWKYLWIMALFYFLLAFAVNMKFKKSKSF